MEYREYQPPRGARQTVQCLWSIEGHASELGAALQPVLPDGRPEVVLHLGDAFERIDGESQVRQGPVLFAGQLTRQLLLRPTGRIAVVGMRLRPFAGPALTREPMSRLAGLTAPLSDVAPALGRVLQGIRDHTPSPDEAIRLLLVRALPLLTAEPDARLAAAVDRIEACAGCVPVESVAIDVGVTRRHLERLFQNAIGITPKRLARIVRFQRALQVLESDAPPGAGARAAAACGYADQAHFIRDFTTLAGVPPGQHLLERCELTGFFTTAGSRRPRE